VYFVAVTASSVGYGVVTSRHGIEQVFSKACISYMCILSSFSSANHLQQYHTLVIFLLATIVIFFVPMGVGAKVWRAYCRFKYGSEKVTEVLSLVKKNDCRRKVGVSREVARRGYG